MAQMPDVFIVKKTSESKKDVGYEIVEPKTNADRIRTMSDEELADKFEEIQLKTVKAYGNDDLLLKGELKKYWFAWLKEEVNE